MDDPSNEVEGPQFQGSVVSTSQREKHHHLHKKDRLGADRLVMSDLVSYNEEECATAFTQNDLA